MRIAYFGLPLGALLLAADGHELTSIVLSPIEAPGRRRLARSLPAERILDALGGADVAAEVGARFAREPPDLIVSWFWTRLLPEAWLARARLGGINAHPSLLPRHRGPNPYFWAIDAGDEQTGATVHRLSRGYDEGAVLLSKRVPVAGRNAWQLARALDRPALELLREAARRLAAGERLPERAQDESLATLAPEPEGEALRASFAWPVERVLRRVRALSPVPGLALEVGGVAFFVTRARATDDYPRALVTGEAAVVASESLVVRCADRALAVERAVLGESPRRPELVEGTELDERSLGRLVLERLASDPGRSGAVLD